MTRHLIAALALVTAALVAAPVAHGAKPKLAKPKLFRVAFSGTDTADVTRSRPVPRREGCVGTVTEKRHLTASFGVRPVRSRAVITNEPGYELIEFKARITSPKYSYRLDTSGAWSRDPGAFDPDLPDPEPTACAFTHEHTSLGCDWQARAQSRRGADFTLIPVNGRYNLAVNSTFGTPLLDCQRQENLQLIYTDPPRTKLRQATVERLAPGKRVKVTGTTVLPHDRDFGQRDGHDRGRERLKYTLAVTRIR